MDLDDYPLLNEPNVMLVALKTAARRPVGPEDCIRRLIADLRRIGEDVPDDLGALRQRVEEAFRSLAIAGLLDPGVKATFTLTDRGRKVLEDHPSGVDSSVLAAFPEFRAYIRGPRTRWEEDEGIGVPVEPRPAYGQGFAAFAAGRGIADNPYPFDSVDHLEWENGWSEARQEASRRAGR